MTSARDLDILMLSLDRDLFTPQSESAARHIRLGELVQSLHIVVAANLNYARLHLSRRVTIYPSRFVLPRAAQILQQQGIDLVSSQDPLETGLLGLILARYYARPLLVQYHGDFLDNPAWLAEHYLNALRNRLGKQVLAKADAVRTVSRRSARYLNGRLGIPQDKITVYPVPPASPLTATQAHKLRRANGDIVIAAVGRLDPAKNFSLLLHALALARRQVPQFKLKLAGDGRERKRLKKLASRLRLTNAVEFLGYQSDLSTLWNEAAFMVSASAHEGWGRAAAEALKSGIPVVATDAGLAGEILIHEKNGLIVREPTDKALAAALVRLGEEPGLYERLRQGALKTHIPAYEDSLPHYVEHWLKVVERRRKV